MRYLTNRRLGALEARAALAKRTTIRVVHYAAEAWPCGTYAEGDVLEEIVYTLRAGHRPRKTVVIALQAAA